ncbi:kinase-like protein, partial [Punctularia strigosozonata HHB-11173 SS5]|uniref:kinase-like protein n=1 Tax=Punctularia strigosozonata (strain HHB-11173) TaxID=741275 RepID=UPI0004417A08
KEALVCSYLRHPNILPVLGVDVAVYQPFMCLVSPWMYGGTVVNYLATRRGSTSLDAMIEMVVSGLAYLHGECIVHGDLKGSNILVDEQGNIRLADFGLAELTECWCAGSTVGQGSTRYMGPELHDPDSFGLVFKRTYASDMYALACLFLEMLTGMEPFHEIQRDSTVILQVISGGRPTRPESSSCHGIHLPDDLWGIMEDCWKRQPHFRPS